MTTSTPLVQLRRAEPGEYKSLIGRPIDNTALSAFMTCPKLYDYSMRQHRRAEGRTRPALAFGSALHVGLETVLKLGTNERAQELGFDGLHEAAATKMFTKWKDHDSPDDYRTIDRAVRDIGLYLTKYGEPARRPDRTIGWPDVPFVEVSTEVTWQGAVYPYAVKIDHAFTESGRNYVEDHKSTSQFGASFFMQFTLKNQMAGYIVVAQELIGAPILGIRINALICRKSGTEFARETIHHPQGWLKAWKQNYNEWVQKIADCSLAEQEMRAAGVDEVTIDTLAFPRNFNACDAKYGMCQYAGICSLPPEVRLKALEQDYPEPTPWNPLEADDDE